MHIVDWIIIAVIVAGIIIGLFGLDRYRGARTSPGEASGARPTDEVFIDPDTGRRTRVWYDPSTGKRGYRPEPE
jgi:hypothetical protein